VIAQLDDDDAEISALEKKLGLSKQGKLNKSFVDDGLDLLLHDIGEDSTADQAYPRKRSNDEDTAWLDMKRRRTSRLPADNVELKYEQSHSSDSEEEDTSDLEDISGQSLMLMPDRSDRDNDRESAASDSPDWDESDDVAIPDHAAPRVRENPYVAPITSADKTAPQKYIPPSLRNSAADGADAEAMSRLRRRTQGLLNRLSEANILTILNDFEKLYQENPRQHVTTTIHDLLIERIRDTVSLSDTFIILHAGLIAGLYRLVGVVFGAQVVQRLVQEFDYYYELSQSRPNAEGSKETLNLISLLAQLYNFQVTGSTLVFDYIRQFLSTLSELHTELLLRVIRSSGPALRQDDPSALKDIVILLQKATAAASGAAAPSVRTLFMIEAISDLKNNKLKSAAGAASGLDAEHIHRMRKMLGTLNARGVVRASEPLQVGLADLHDTKKMGKWWLAGASWRGRDISVDHSTSIPGNLTNNTEESSTLSRTDDLDISDSTPDLLHLAAAARMNTNVRRAIFVALLSASDASDAQQRLHGLRLSQTQRPEMARVLLHCAGAEATYNPYYALVARRVCADVSKMGIAFQFTLWDLFGKLEAAEDDGDTIGLEAVVNSARFYAALIGSGAVRIGVLKVSITISVTAKLETNPSKESRPHSSVAATPDFRGGVTCHFVISRLEECHVATNKPLRASRRSAAACSRPAMVFEKGRCDVRSCAAGQTTGPVEA